MRFGRANPGRGGDVMRRLAVLAAFVAFALAAAACGVEETAPGGGDGEATGLLAAVQARGQLRVSTDPAYPPQSFQDTDGEYKGFDIDVATEIADRLGVEIEWVTPAWDLIIAGNWNGRWDLSVGSMTITPKREKVLHFSPPYYYTPAAVAVHESNTSITDLENDLDGKSIGVCGGCTYDFYLSRELEIPGENIEYVVDDPDIRTYDTDSSAIEDLSLGDGTRLDAAMSALPTLSEAVESGKPIKVVGDPLYYEPLAAAIDREAPEDPMPLVDEVSKIIEDMHEDGTLSELSEKWYGVDITAKQ
jgi:polar amino acid transport system substrate-binding protein